MVQKIAKTIGGVWIGTALWMMVLGTAQCVHDLELPWWQDLPLMMVFIMAGFAMPVLIIGYCVNLWMSE